MSMSFTKIAQAERKKVLLVDLSAQMTYRGWHLVDVPAQMLEDLHIDFELTDEKSIYAPRHCVFAPVWVFGVRFNVVVSSGGRDSQWDIIRGILITTRDSAKEQELVSAELSLDAAAPPSVRHAARNFLEVMSGQRKSETKDESQ